MIALCSGGFSILHVGHLDCFEKAAEYGKVVVALNSDQWLKRKYGKVVVSWGHRARLLKALKVVHDVVPVKDDDGTVCEVIRRIKPDFFVNGGDREKFNYHEHRVCLKYGTVEIFVQTTPIHSSQIMRKLR